VIGHVVILRPVDKRRFCERLSNGVHYTMKEDDKRLGGGICVGQFGWWSNWEALSSGWAMVRFSAVDPNVKIKT
jgi:hypothetical protein